MTDIVERLRNHNFFESLMGEAADEIEQLREAADEVEQLRAALSKIRDWTDWGVTSSDDGRLRCREFARRALEEK